MHKKLDELNQYLQSLGSAIIAYSGGVDSTFLLKAAHNILKDSVIAVTLDSPVFLKQELYKTKEFCKKENIKHIICEFDNFSIEGFNKNPKDRCYICKKEMFTRIKKIAEENKIKHILEGSNIDDNSDNRPGLKAVKELNIKSPLQNAGLTKTEIRALSKKI